jgi:paraquat-inducible protein A
MAGGEGIGALKRCHDQNRLDCAGITLVRVKRAAYCSAARHRIACCLYCHWPPFSFIFPSAQRVNPDPGNEPNSPLPPPSRVGEGRLIACRECDLLQYEVALDRHADAHCTRCNSVLYRGTRTSLALMLALMASCAVLLIVSNLFPIAVLEVQGAHVEATLINTVITVYNQGRELVATLVLLTTIVLPAIEIACMLYLLVPLALGRIAPDTPAVFRLVLTIHPWSMMEIMLLGVLVTLVKLTDFANIIPGASLWSFCALIVFFTMAASAFSVRDFWAWVEERDRALPMKESLS